MLKNAFCICGAGSGVGKTTLTIGLLAALKKRGLKLQPFKCGPDYIDPGFHGEACGVVSRNLDSWMMGGEESVVNSFANAAADADCAVVEGVMGMFDGVSPVSIEGSSAHIAQILSVPVILVINGRGIAGTVAPLVKGFIDFKPGIKIAGIIANNVSSDRHAGLLAEALDAEKLPPLLGCLPRNEKWALPERHLGLAPNQENTKSCEWHNELASEIEAHIDIDRLLNATSFELKKETRKKTVSNPVKARLGIAQDKAFHFYYQDNLDMLEEAGFELVPFSPINDEVIPSNLDGHYIGGGFPEIFASDLEKNKSMRNDIFNFAEKGGFIYAECGGFMYLCESMSDIDGNEYSMCGIIPAGTKMEKRLHRLGYVEVRSPVEGPFKDMIWRGHEFHWSSISYSSNDFKPAFEIIKPRRSNSEWEPTGAKIKNVWVSYVHAHFASCPEIPARMLGFIE
jgi:cobyrinic acid a,c-diamide synthase